MRTPRRAARFWFLRGRGGGSPPAVSVAVFVSFRTVEDAGPYKLCCANRPPHREVSAFFVVGVVRPLLQSNRATRFVAKFYFHIVGRGAMFV